jgi:hypothetical protein
LSNTPILRSITPSNGTSLGGTHIRLLGEFGSSVSSPFVTLNGIACMVTNWTNSDIDCVTGYRGPDNIQTGSVEIMVPGNGIAVSGDTVLFAYIDRWSDVNSWKNKQLPVDGDFVWIPDGQSIVLDVNTPDLLFLLVQGALYLDPTVPHISIDSKYIFVYGGLLQVLSFTIRVCALMYLTNYTCTYV